MKPNKQQFFVGLLLALIVVIIILQATSKPPISWLESYDKMDKAPYGGRVFYEQFSKIISPEAIKEINLSTYEWLNSKPEAGTLLIFNSSFFPDKETSKKLLQWIKAGNTAFISARLIEESFLDSIGVNIQTIIELENFQEHSTLYLEVPGLPQGEAFTFERTSALTYFSFPDSLPIKVLGKNKFSDSTKDALPNFISMPYGDGDIILHLFPLAFTNYFLLDKENKAYTESVLGYLPKNQLVYYDNYIKNGKSVFGSPLYLFLANSQLKMAYYSILVMLVLWIVFEGRRKQRSIPVINPLPNQTVGFAETIASMYLEKKAYHENVQQQIALFMEYCRATFRLSTESIDEENIQKIAARSGYPLDKTRNLFAYIHILQNKAVCKQEDVIELHKRIKEIKSYQYGRK